MNPGVFDEMARQDENSWYYRGKRAAMSSILGQARIRVSKIIDLGCGTGVNAAALVPFSKSGAQYVGIEPHSMVFRAPSIFRPRVIRKRMEQVSLEEIGGPADLVMMIDVLEHVDEATGLQTALRFLSSNGQLLITVPAYGFLWGKSDIDGQHRTRYTPAELKESLERQGFEVIAWNHYFAFAFFPLLIISWWQRRGVKGEIGGRGYFGPQSLNRLLGLLAVFEGRLGRWIRWPCGTGIVCLARKSRQVGE